MMFYHIYIKEVIKMKKSIKITESQYIRLKGALIEGCWKNYKQVGMKEKGGKQVPNCIPENKEDIKEYGNEFGLGNEFDNSELDAQEDFYDNMNQDSKDSIKDGVNPITGYDVDKVSPSSEKQKPRSTQHNPTTYSSTQIEKSTSDVRNNRDTYESKEYKKLKQLKESFYETFNKIKRLNESELLDPIDKLFNILSNSNDINNEGMSTTVSKHSNKRVFTDETYEVIIGSFENIERGGEGSFEISIHDGVTAYIKFRYDGEHSQLHNNVVHGLSKIPLELVSSSLYHIINGNLSKVKEFASHHGINFNKGGVNEESKEYIDEKNIGSGFDYDSRYYK